MPKIKYAATSSWKKYICKAISATAAHQTHFGTRLMLIRILTPAFLDASRGPNEPFANPSPIHQLRVRATKSSRQNGKQNFRECDPLCEVAPTPFASPAGATLTSRVQKFKLREC